MNLKKWKYIIVTGVSIILIFYSITFWEAGMGEGYFFAFLFFLSGVGILILFGLWDIFQYWRKKKTSGEKLEEQVLNRGDDEDSNQ